MPDERRKALRSGSWKSTTRIDVYGAVRMRSHLAVPRSRAILEPIMGCVIGETVFLPSSQSMGSITHHNLGPRRDAEINTGRPAKRLG